MSRRIVKETERKKTIYCDSSNKDYNHILAKQPRKSIGLTKFDIPRNIQQYPLTTTLSVNKSFVSKF